MGVWRSIRNYFSGDAMTYNDTLILNELKAIHVLLQHQKVVIEVKCCCCRCGSQPPSQPPPAPMMPQLGKGDSVRMIRYTYTMPGFSGDVTKNRFSYSENGGEVHSTEHDTPGATGTFDVNDGAAVSYWSNQCDAAGNWSNDSVHGEIASAVDGVAPPAPETPTVGPGDTAPPMAPSLSAGKKVKGS